ncbi:Mob1/phocein [Mycena albidolilacea]|uniref:Mob1/phocein n=1 Tax=Mycena albidolilacea TaxID=1033008 RepID=A0AAD7EBT9_9AGAR|nr:Mob1/phocein [Mycena albidolilacea]
MALVQRPLRGSRISTFYPVKSLPSLSSLDSAFQLQEYISLLIRLDVHDVDAIVSIPGRAAAKQKEKEREADPAEDAKEKTATVDEACWKYEQLRRLAQDLSHPLITSLQQVCTRTTCPEMKAGEWLYLCVAHGNDGAMEQCCAIDYILHTLDSATALLNSPRAFPSRLQIPPASHRHFTSLARRLGRIFAHAYFHHREEFEQAEAESSLYARFLALTERFDLVPADFLVIPARATTSNVPTRQTADERGEGVGDVPQPTLLGAALHVDTDAAAPSPFSSTPADASSTASTTSPPGLEDVVSPQSASRRYGRSRTDTMMLEGESTGRFPLSPATAATEGEGEPTGLGAQLRGVLASPPSEPQTEKEQAKEEEPTAAQEPEPEPEPLVGEPELRQPSSPSDPEPAPPSPTSEPPSPSSDDGAGAALGPVVSPSSSTAPQTEGHAIRSMLERDHERREGESENAGQVGEQEAGEGGGVGEAGVPNITVVPATPPAVDEAGEGASQDKEEKEEAKEGEKAAAVVPEVEAEKAKAKDEALAAPAPAPAAPAETASETPANAEEEVDVTDAEVSPVVEKTGPEEPKPDQDKQAEGEKAE